MENIILSKICQKCAECCKHNPFIKLPQNEIEAIEHYTGLKSTSFMNAIGKPEDGYFLKFKENGSCIFLEKNKDKSITISFFANFLEFFYYLLFLSL